MIRFCKRNYPLTFRATELKMIAEWIDGHESGSVIGLGGAGKSNLLTLIAHHPQLIKQYLAQPNSKLVLIPVDLNTLPNYETATFYRVLLRALYEAHQQWAAVEPTIIHHTVHFYRQIQQETDPFVCQSALRELLLLCQEKELRVVLVLDSFDQFCRTATTPVLDNLRGVRDSFKTMLSYLVGMRHLMTYIRDPTELGELHEILDMHRCWLGALTEADASCILEQIEKTLSKRQLVEAERKLLLNITGGYPSLLKGVTWWLAKQQPPPEPTEWINCLLLETSIINRLQELWEGLTGEEQITLKLLHQLQSEINPTREQDISKKYQKRMTDFSNKYKSSLVELQQKTVCRKHGGQWFIFSPLFAEFINTAKSGSLGRITYNEKLKAFFQGETELKNLTPKDSALLQYFVRNSSRHCNIDELIGAGWSDDDPAGVSNETVQHAIYELRKKIEPLPTTPCYLVGKYGQGYRFFPEGAPQR